MLSVTVNGKPYHKAREISNQFQMKNNNNNSNNKNNFRKRTAVTKYVQCVVLVLKH